MTASSPARTRVLAATTVLAFSAISIGLSGVTSPPASAAEANPVTITPNPAYQNEAFEGWGTSLVWFANATGDYPEAVRQDLFDKVFGEDGLNLNIARYNIGGGNASDVPSYLRPGGAVDGWWNPDLDASDADGAITSNYADRDRYAAAWGGEDPNSYNFDADKTQRWWVDALKDKITKWEAFSNSPPYFMTESGYASGGFDSSAEQLKPSSVADFATYLKTVAQSVEEQEGIRFDTIDPFNEPNTNYWGTSIDSSTGWPNGGRQEGAHVGPAMQDTVIKALAAELAKDNTTTDAVISAMDETNPGTFATNWNGWSQEAKDSVGQLNVHTYGTSGRLGVRDIAKSTSKPLWMSEVGGDWDGTGVNNQTNMNNGIGMASRIMDDLRELEPSAWVLWQPVEDYYNMEKVEKLNWGSVLIDFDCNVDGNSVRRLADGDADPSCKVLTNAKYNTLRNFTHYILPGDHIIPSTNKQTTSAVTADGTGVTLVHANSDTTARTITVDLSKFGTINQGATLTPIVTTESTAEDTTKNALVEGEAIAVDAASKTAVVTVPAKSVSTFVITGVSGVAEGASPLEDGHQYRIVGAQSGKAITANNSVDIGTTPGATITTLAATNATVGPQLWTAEKVTDGQSNAERFVLRSASGTALAATSSGTVLVESSREDAAADPSQQWILTSSDGSNWSLVNCEIPSALEIPGGSTVEGAPVNVYTSNGGGNQSWSFQSTQLLGFSPVVVNTVAGVPASLPAAVTPLYATGPGTPVGVTWRTEGIDWNDGPITVTGSGTDVFGTAFDSVTATVEVGGFASTDPVSLTTYAGISRDTVIAAAPTTVPAQIGASTNRFDAAVTWNWDDLTTEQLAAVGVVTVSGSALSNDASADPLDATLSIIITEAGEVNVAVAGTTTATATSTESGYSVDNTRNGVTSDKGWSNWRSSNKPTSDTLTYNLGTATPLTSSTMHFYRDGGATSWPASITVEYLDEGDTWVPVPGSPTALPSPEDGTAPIVDVPLTDIATSQLRVVMEAYPNTHMVVSEVEIFAKAPGVASVADLAKLTVNGTPVEGFTAANTDYTVPLSGSALPTVSAAATDTNATVEIDQATSSTGADATATVTVTAQDGTTVEIYRIAFTRTASVSAPTISGTPKVGAVLTATAFADPVDATLGYSWTKNGEPIDGADSATYTPVAADTGASVGVTVAATAEGYRVGQAASDTVVITAAEDEEPGGENPGGGDHSGGDHSGANPGGESPGNGTARGSATGQLSNTGSDVPWALMLSIGGLLLLGGAVLTLGRPRRRH
ncbi:glycoside hydrolase [Glaciibacter superstes]|uniref:glycoside hydrolase n=1 Tax=Glaciibacter superstes TaxID=501023 RepID=UPI0003B50849|nr:glycoside hydrolase [Glaciibacter superstes]